MSKKRLSKQKQLSILRGGSKPSSRGRSRIDTLFSKPFEPRNTETIEAASMSGAVEDVNRILDHTYAEAQRRLAQEHVERAIDQSKPDFQLEDLGASFPSEGIVTGFKSDREAAVGELVTLLTKQLGSLAAVDAAAVLLGRATNDSAKISAHSMKVNINHVFTIAFLRKMAERAGLGEVAVAAMEKSYAEKAWGSKPPPLDSVYAGERASRGSGAGNRGGGGDTKRAAPVVSSQSGKPVGTMSRGFSPFGNI